MFLFCIYIRYIHPPLEVYNWVVRPARPLLQVLVLSFQAGVFNENGSIGCLFHKPPLSPHFTGAVVASRPKDRCHWSSTLAAATLQLPRTKRCFDVIETDPYLDYRLPKRPNATAGVILKGIYDTVDHILKVHQPCIYKLGFTHDPYFRFHNNIYGYSRELDQWEKMTVIYASHEPISCAFVEGALIQRHKGNLHPLKYIIYYMYLSFWGHSYEIHFLPQKIWSFIDFGATTSLYNKRSFFKWK